MQQGVTAEEGGTRFQDHRLNAVLLGYLTSTCRSSVSDLLEANRGEILRFFRENPERKDSFDNSLSNGSLGGLLALLQSVPTGGELTAAQNLRMASLLSRLRYNAGLTELPPSVPWLAFTRKLLFKIANTESANS